MTKDKDILENFSFLYKILDYLIHNCKAYFCSFDKLYEHFYDRDLETDNKFNALNYYTAISESKSNNIEDVFLNFSVSDNTQAQGEKLVEACYYLMKQNYIRIDVHFNIKITFEGILKCSEGFLKEYEKYSNDKNRLLNVENFQRKTTRWMLWINGAIAVGTVVAMIYYILEILSVHFCKCG
ncbi:hypothetical protein [Flavobacterium sp. UMI-01]|uniref:hypothetical protein n=1 Tax=Flavobacterium sp. UMI-01 TaxID=1441053 RepID=UPI001C7CE94F|nr:hypothetical protein [Flavobacterium sp. UMI-01]GIZ07686.1 hypothetical protein FUMI01_04130 [Flavobacterium sp. UMI-01]